MKNIYFVFQVVDANDGGNNQVLPNNNNEKLLNPVGKSGLCNGYISIF